MAKRLYSFPQTPEAIDELASVCAVLDEHHIRYYETPGSTWGFSRASLWIEDDSDADRARQLFAQHAQEYALRARERYQQETGYNPNASTGEKLRFHLHHLNKRKLMILPLLGVLILLVLYFQMLFNLFQG
ncbi:MAG: DUF6164 family protein [Gammaproteobacteria bacterium]|nr:DUF6164 family protein [Gammaproteobacteria bacterium]